LAQARNKRFAARKTIAEGVDPGAKKKTEKRLAVFRAENTFEGVAKEWFENNKPQWTKEHADRLWRRIEIHLNAEIGKRPISEISTLELLGVIRKVEKQKITKGQNRIKRRGGTEVSHRVLQTASAIFNYAIVTERMTNNPAFPLRDGRALKPHKAKNYPTIKAKEIPEFLKGLEEANTSLQNKLAIRLMMLTFVRTGELRKSTWKDVDLEAKEWRLPAHITKMRDEHIVPLSRQTMALFKELHKISGHRELLFPPQQHRKLMLMSENTINMVIKRMGYEGKLVGHGFRALASTTLNEMGFPPDVIERQLAHAERNKIRAAYNRAEYLSQRQEMMQTWADLIDGLVAKKGKVIIGKFGKAA
jgi:integrase